MKNSNVKKIVVFFEFVIGFICLITVLLTRKNVLWLSVLSVVFILIAIGDMYGNQGEKRNGEKKDEERKDEI